MRALLGGHSFRIRTSRLDPGSSFGMWELFPFDSKLHGDLTYTIYHKNIEQSNQHASNPILNMNDSFRCSFNYFQAEIR